MKRNPKQFKLDFVGIGAERSATTWLSKCLDEHPEICIPEKELFFFNEYDPHYLTVKNYRYKKGKKWLESKFLSCPVNAIKGEFSPTYLYDETAARRIRKDYPGIKILVSLRNPVERAYSQYINDLRMGVIPKMSFEEAIKKYSSYVEKGYYYKYLKNYFSVFPKKNILIVFYDDIVKDPGNVVERIYTFLGVKSKDFKPSVLHIKDNVSSSARIRFLNFWLMQTDYYLRKHGLDFILNFADEMGIRKLAMKLRDLNSREIKNNHVINPATYRSLKKMFFRDNKKLRGYLKYS